MGGWSQILHRASIDAARDAGLMAVQRLDAIVANQLRDDPATVAVWRAPVTSSARRVRRRRASPCAVAGSGSPAGERIGGHVGSFSVTSPEDSKMPSYRFGKHLPTLDNRTLRFSRYVTSPSRRLRRGTR